MQANTRIFFGLFARRALVPDSAHGTRFLFWFPTYEADGKTLDRVAIEESDGVVVMAYRNNSKDVQALAAPILAHAAELKKRVTVAIETECVEPNYVTFCGQSASELAQAMGAIESGLRGSPAYAGLAVHSSASWKRLESRETREAP